MKKEELFETLSDLDPAMVEKGAGLISRSAKGLHGKNGRPRQPAR